MPRQRLVHSSRHLPGAEAACRHRSACADAAHALLGHAQHVPGTHVPRRSPTKVRNSQSHEIAVSVQSYFVQYYSYFVPRLPANEVGTPGVGETTGSKRLSCAQTEPKAEVLGLTKVTPGCQQSGARGQGAWTWAELLPPRAENSSTSVLNSSKGQNTHTQTRGRVLPIPLNATGPSHLSSSVLGAIRAVSRRIPIRWEQRISHQPRDFAALPRGTLSRAESLRIALPSVAQRLPSDCPS